MRFRHSSLSVVIIYYNIVLPSTCCSTASEPPVALLYLLYTKQRNNCRKTIPCNLHDAILKIDWSGVDNNKIGVHLPPLC